MITHHGRVGVVQISYELIEQHLAQPSAAGWIFRFALPINVRVSHDVGCLEYLLFAPFFPQVPENAPIPVYKPTASIDYDESTITVHFVEVEEPHRVISEIVINTLAGSARLTDHKLPYLSRVPIEATADTMGVSVEDLNRMLAEQAKKR